MANIFEIYHSFHYFVLFHVLMSFVFSYGSFLYLKNCRFVVKSRRVIYFMFIFNLSLPILGYIATLWLTYYFKHIKYKLEVDNIQFLDLGIFETDFIEIERQFGEGSIQDMMLNKYIPTAKKIKALVSMADNISQENIQIIKSTLSSKDDEVRLYSFAIIDKIEREINGKIYKLLKVYKTLEDGKSKASMARELATLYWEMIYYELSEKSLQEYLLKEVKGYLKIAQEFYNDDIKLHILLGKIYMLEKNYIKASSEFTLANELSEHELPFVKSYIAEINFLTGHYVVVKNIIKNADGLDLNAKMYPIVEQWRAS